mmetsp:Transcript_1875/g.2579  ORF Transcript_1875/g.2579 Transcript_1875/m.2579 type:complete len:159 (-) Transcript_1875:2560-3036(-)
MLKIKLEKTNTGQINIDKSLAMAGITTDEESTHFVDTSDLIQSDQESLLHEGEQDAYQKIKIHANLALRNLVKNNSLSLFNYWYILFPSFLLRPHPEFDRFLTTFNKKEFSTTALEFIEHMEPSLFFVVRQSINQSQLRSSIYTTIQVMLENSTISKL